MKTWASIIYGNTVHVTREDGRVRASMVSRNRPKSKTGGAKKRNWSFKPGKPAPCTVTTFT